jgi:hypothetical protein
VRKIFNFLKAATGPAFTQHLLQAKNMQARGPGPVFTQRLRPTFARVQLLHLLQAKKKRILLCAFLT